MKRPFAGNRDYIRKMTAELEKLTTRNPPPLPDWPGGRKDDGQTFTVQDMADFVGKRPRKKSSTSPTQRALADLKKMGFDAVIVERWCSFTKRRKDLLGCLDLLAAREGIGLIGIQVTSGDNHAARMTKLKANERLPIWMRCGLRVECWSYSKRGERGKKKTWQLRREPITND